MTAKRDKHILLVKDSIYRRIDRHLTTVSSPINARYPCFNIRPAGRIVINGPRNWKTGEGCDKRGRFPFAETAGERAVSHEVRWPAKRVRRR